MDTKPEDLEVEDMMTFSEAQALMDEHTSSIPWEGSLPALKDTSYLVKDEDADFTPAVKIDIQI